MNEELQVGELLESLNDFIEYLRLSGKSQDTITTYSKKVKIFLDYIKDKQTIDRKDIISFIRYVREERGYNDRSLMIVGWSLKSFFEFLGKHDIAKWIPVQRPNYIEERVWLPKEKIEYIIDSIPVLVVAYDLALRLGEVLLLKTKNYNPDTGEIIVYRLKHKGKPNTYHLKVTESTREILNEYIHGETPPEDQLFPMTKRVIQYLFRRRVEQAGLDPKKYTFHVLRHSRLTHIAIDQLVNKGYVDVLSLSKFAGHLNPSTTLQYVHLASKYLSFQAKRIV